MIKADVDPHLSDSDCLNMAVYSVNCTMGPEGLCPMFLVFGAVPFPTSTTPSTSQLQSALCIERTIVAAEKEHVRHLVRYRLRHQGNYSLRTHTEKPKRLPHVSNVLVFIKVSRAWTGHLSLIHAESNTASIPLQKGRPMFRTACIRPWRPAVLK